MKKYIFIAFLLVSISVYSQSSAEPRPFWADATPNPPAGANYFLNWGVGEGNNEQEAVNVAWVDALSRSLHELGVVGITQQDIDVIATKGMNAIVKFNRMKRRIVSATKPVRLSGKRIKIYILVQVQLNVNGVDDFYTLDASRYKDSHFNNRLKGYNAQQTGHYPFSARVFVPGMAQLHKGSKAKGLFFIVGEAACVGGLVIAESLRASYDSKAVSTQNTEQKKTYYDRADNCENIRNGLIAGAAVLYIWNVIDGIAAKGKKRTVMLGDTQLRISPYATPQCGGFALSFNF